MLLSVMDKDKLIIKNNIIFMIGLITMLVMKSVFIFIFCDIFIFSVI